MPPLFSLVLFTLLISSSLFLNLTNAYGWSGANGSRGYPGRDGRDQTIFLQGQESAFQISGTDGGDGGNGENGLSSYGSCGPGTFGGDGGNGGDGGDGGDGGRGGDILAYYQNIKDLRKIFVESRGGLGGRGGIGGSGGSGCTCYGSSDPNYTCISGSNGWAGSSGRHGLNGRNGILRLVKSQEPLPTVRPEASVTLATLLDEVVPLSFHHWWNRPAGALSLLAPGSYLQDSYYDFDRTVYRDIALQWESDRAQELFSRQSLPLQINLDEITVAYPNNWWVKVVKDTEGPRTTHTIKGIVTEQEAKEISMVKLIGERENLVLELEDKAGVAHLLKNQFRLTFERKQVMWYRTVFTKEVPADLVTIVNKHKIQIAVGKLVDRPIFMFKGKKVLITLSLTRSYAGRSAKCRFSRKFVI